MKEHQTGRRESGKAVKLRGTEAISEDLRRVVEQLDLRPHFEVLDVASGLGVLARAVAPHVKRVVASDISRQALSASAPETPSNVRFEHAEAEDLPYDAGSFDMVVTRFSIHHFLRPELALHEMCRVCRPGGELLLIDIVAPEDPVCARRYNRVQRSRDTSHHCALSSRELDDAVAKAGWHLRQRLSRDIEREATEWLAAYPLDPIRSGWIVRELQSEIAGGPPTGLQPFLDGGKLKIVYRMEVIRAAK